jgi:hypothetical protein
MVAEKSFLSPYIAYRKKNMLSLALLIGPGVRQTANPGPERILAMLQSHVIDIDGAFVGAAVRLDRGYRFIATDIRLDDLDGSIWPTLADVKRLARELYLTSRIARPAAAKPALREQSRL